MAKKIQIIKFKRRVGASGPPTIADIAEPGEPATVIHNGRADLWISDGALVHELIHPNRQVERTGNQTITGEKTFSPDSFKLTGGTNGSILKTDGSGNVNWEAPGLQSVHADDPLTGNGTSANPLGLDYASDSDIAAGTDEDWPLNSKGLRSQLGAAASTLGTASKTIVPALNELLASINAVAGALQFVGDFDAEEGEVTAADVGTLTVEENLPAASADNEGWFVIVTVAGAPADPVESKTDTLAIGDWIVSTGNAWIHVPLHHAAMTGTNVGLTAVSGWSNVQEAIEGLHERTSPGALAIIVDGVSIVGEGTTADPLEVAEIDGGEF